MWLFGLTALAGGLTDCFTNPPDTREPYRCAHRIARSTDDYAPVIARIRAERQKHPDHPWASHTLGSLLTESGELNEGIEMYEEAKRLFGPSGDVLGQVYVRLNLGTWRHQRGDREGSRREYLEAAQIAERNDRGDLKHAAQLSLARGLLKDHEQLGRAWRIATTVYDEVSPDGEYQTQLLALHVLIGLAIVTDRTNEQLTFLQQALSLSIENSDNYTIASNQLDLADTINESYSLGQNTLEDFAGRVHELTDSIRASSNPYIIALSYCTDARTSSLLGDHTGAVANAKKCVAATQALDDENDQRSAFISLSFALAPTDCSAAKDAWKSAEALANTEHSRHSLPLEYLEIVGICGQPDAIRDALPAARQALKSLREAQTDRASRAGLMRTHGQFIAMAAAWMAGYDKAQPVDLRLALELADVVRGQPAQSTLDLESLQASIPAGTALVDYQLPRTFDDGWAAVVTHTEARVVSLKDVEKLPARVDTFNGLIEARDPLASTAAAQLYQQLLAPLKLPPTIEHLVVLPTGPLHHLALDAVVPRDSSLSISLIPSYRWWINRTSPRSGPTKHPAILGDPSNLTDLPPLPQAHAEVAMVDRWVGDPAYPPVLQDEASKQWMLRNTDADWIHLATHVLVDDRFPEQTAAFFANGQTLTAEEVREQTWNHPVIVLSACRSASGRVLGGEAPLGLSRAFIESGAAAVIGTLWPMRDTDSLVFFEEFYQHLSDGESLEAALHSTKISRRNAGAAEEAWAGVVLVGDGRGTVQTHHPDPLWWPWLATLGLGGIGVLGLWWKRST